MDSRVFFRKGWYMFSIRGLIAAAAVLVCFAGVVRAQEPAVPVADADTSRVLLPEHLDAVALNDHCGPGGCGEFGDEFPIVAWWVERQPVRSAIRGSAIVTARATRATARAWLAPVRWVRNRRCGCG